MMTTYLKLFTVLSLAIGCYGYVRMCYFTNWSQYSQFKVSSIDPFKCTHIVYAFGKLSGTNIVDIEWNEATIQRRVVALKTTNPSLKILLAIGGWTADNSQYAKLVASEVSMQAFADNAITYLRNRGFDGLDLDWEYPGDTTRGSSAIDRTRFTRWLQILQNNFQAEAAQNRRSRLLLSAATLASIAKANKFYEIDKIGNYLDYVNLMTYDYHGSWDGNSVGVQHHSALYPDVNSSVIGWIEAGFPAHKLTMGMGAYGRSYKLSTQPTGTGLGMSPNGYDTLKYTVICNKINNGYNVISLSSDGAVAAIGQANGQWEWIGFDNADYFRRKANYIKANGLAGSMVWSLDQDDPTDTCGGGRFPLQSALQALLPETDNPSTPVNTQTTPSTTQRPWTPYPTYYPPPNPVPTCHMLFPAPPRCIPRTESVPGSDSSYYLVCRDNVYAIQCTCLNNMFFNPCKQRCDIRTNYFTCSLMFG